MEVDGTSLVLKGAYPKKSNELEMREMRIQVGTSQYHAQTDVDLWFTVVRYDL